MRRREFLAGLGGLAFNPARARDRVPRVGLIFASTPDFVGKLGLVEDLRAGLKEQGYVDGQNVVVEIRYGERRPERLPALTAELVNLPVDVLVGAGEIFEVEMRASATLPVVSAGTRLDLVALGVIQSFAHPGGHVTGIGIYGAEQLAKRLELLARCVAGLRKVGLLLYAQNLPPLAELTETAAREFNVELRSFVLEGAQDFGPPIQEIADWGGALMLADASRFTAFMADIAALALKYRLPSVGASEFAAAGIMLGFGSDPRWQYRRAAAFVAKILDGVNPGDLPFERPTRYLTKVNLKSAAALGVTIPPDVLTAADEVIE